MKKYILLIIALFLQSFIYAQDDSWKITGQVQLRSELDGRDFSNETHALTFASLRTRIGIEKSISDKVAFFAQIQDSRVFGQEASLTANSKNLDLHQGYVMLKDLFNTPISVQAGRFEVSYGTERFFGASNWSYTGRAWDGVRFKYNNGFKLDLFALTMKESVQYIGNASFDNYPLTQTPTPSYSVYGAWESSKLNENNQLDFFGYYEVDRSMVTPYPTNNQEELALQRFTLGVNHFGTFGAFSSIVEAAYQGGKMGATDISSYIVSLSGMYQANKAKFGLGVDILSGWDIGSDKFGTFNVSFGTNHKSYGFMDYFPANSFLAGLHDFYLKSSFELSPSWNLGVDLHHFMSNQKVGYWDGTGTAETSVYGQELDLTLKYNVIAGTTLSWGGSLFFPGEIMKQYFSDAFRGVTKEDTAFWSYLMITANF